MKTLLIAVCLLFTNYCFAQNTYEIRADTVRIYNTCDTSELVLENHTQDTLGFLYNKGKGRTEFRRLQLEKVGASQLAIKGQDTIDLNFSSYNIPTLQQVTGAGRTTTDSISVRSVTASNTSSVPFVPFYKFAHSGLDSVSWEIGLSGVREGAPFHRGDSLTFRSFTKTGSIHRTAMVIQRNGGCKFPCCYWRRLGA